MRAQDFLKHLVLGALALTTGMLVGQSTTPGNVAFLNTDFLGWDNVSLRRTTSCEADPTS